MTSLIKVHNNSFEKKIVNSYFTKIAVIIKLLFLTMCKCLSIERIHELQLVLLELSFVTNFSVRCQEDQTSGNNQQTYFVMKMTNIKICFDVIIC